MLKLRFFRAVITGLILVGSVAVSRGQAPVVYVFLSTECPISQQYARRVSALHRQYATEVRFVALFPSKTDSPRLIRQFRNDYGLTIGGKPDLNAAMARQLRAQVTPEVVLLDGSGRTRYQGAIDDWYVALGKHRSAATQHYLRDALDALLAGKDAPVRQTQAVGCLIE